MDASIIELNPGDWSHCRTGMTKKIIAAVALGQISRRKVAMRVSIPNIPLPNSKHPAFVNPFAGITHQDAVAKVKNFLDKGKGKTLIVTGAGVSVDSGIRAYRGTEGHCEDIVLIMESRLLC